MLRIGLNDDHARVGPLNLKKYTIHSTTSLTTCAAAISLKLSSSNSDRRLYNIYVGYETLKLRVHGRKRSTQLVRWKVST